MFDIRMQSILDDLRAALNADRCTLRLDVPGETFPVVHESLGEGAATLVGERTVVLRGQPVVEALLSGVDQVVQEDCPAASDDPAFHAMLAAYGGLSAQIVTAVRDGDRLVGIVSVHVLGGTREWAPLDLGRARRAAARRRQAPGMRHRLVLDRDASILADDPGPAHNRLHPGIAPVATIDPGDELEADCRDGMDGELRRAASAEALRDVDLGANHPLTGPVAVRGARPGDVLVVELLALDCDAVGTTAVIPGFGLLADRFPEPLLVRWDIADGVARSEQLPGVAIAGRPFLGAVTVAPSHELLTRATAREAALGAAALPPDARGAVPQGAEGREGLRTIPPRENGGNLDIRQLTVGSRLHLPVQSRGRCCRSATRTSRRATASRAGPRSRSPRRRASGSRSAAPASRASAAPCPRTSTPRRPAPSRGGGSRRPGSPSAPAAPTPTWTCGWPRATRCPSSSTGSRPSAG